MYKLSGRPLTGFSLLFIAFTLAACGGGGGSSSTTLVGGGNVDDDTPEETASGSDDFAGTEFQDYLVGNNAILKAGVFTAEVSYTDERENLTGPMFLSATGNFTFPFFDDNFISSGTLTTLGLSDSVGSDISGRVVEYVLFDRWSRKPKTTGTTATIAGFVPSDSNESAFLDTGGLVEEIKIIRDNSASDQSLSFDQIAGIYETTAGSDPQITIDIDGGINGFDRGCIVKGQITIPTDKVDVPNADINIYELSYKASGCTDLVEATGEKRDGNYLGVGTFTPANSEGEAGIEFAASNGKIAFYFAGTK